MKLSIITQFELFNSCINGQFAYFLDLYNFFAFTYAIEINKLVKKIIGRKNYEKK